MARLRRYLNFLNGWEEVEAAVEAYAAELPHLEMLRPQLQELLEQARSLAVQLSDHTSAKQDTYKKLRQAIRNGQALVDLLRTGARQHFGNDSEILVKFGMKPFRGRPRATATKPPETGNPEGPEAPTSTPTPEQTK